MTTLGKTIAARLAGFSLASALCLGAIACEDTQPPTGPSQANEGQSQPPAMTPVGQFRAAQLTREARTVDVLLDGNVTFRALAYGDVTDYVELPQGEHRLQIFPAGERRLTVVETNFSVTGGEAVTMAVVGKNPVEVVAEAEDRTTDPERARMSLFNAVTDFPAGFDLDVVNGPRLVSDLDRYTGSPHVDLIPGVYAFVLLRAGTPERLVTRFGVDMPRATTSTLFAVGTLDRNDIELIVVRDGS